MINNQQLNHFNLTWFRFCYFDILPGFCSERIFEIQCFFFLLFYIFNSIRNIGNGCYLNYVEFSIFLIVWIFFFFIFILGGFLLHYIFFFFIYSLTNYLAKDIVWRVNKKLYANKWFLSTRYAFCSGKLLELMYFIIFVFHFLSFFVW